MSNLRSVSMKRITYCHKLNATYSRAVLFSGVVKRNSIPSVLRARLSIKFCEKLYLVDKTLIQNLLIIIDSNRFSALYKPPSPQIMLYAALYNYVLLSLSLSLSLKYLSVSTMNACICLTMVLQFLFT